VRKDRVGHIGTHEMCRKFTNPEDEMRRILTLIIRKAKKLFSDTEVHYASGNIVFFF